MTGRPDFKASGGELDQSLEQLLDDLIERLQAGEEVDLEALIREHPDDAEAIRRMMPALEALVEFGETSALANGRRPGPGEEAGPPERALGDFRLLREIGRGGMGIVYEAEQVSLGRRVALKLLPMAAALDPRQIQRFRVEAQAAACLHHPHIVPVHGVGCERGVHYYAMQLIEGRSLAAMIAELRRLDGLDPPDGPAPDLAAIPTTDLAARLLSGGAGGPDVPTVTLPATVLPSNLAGGRCPGAPGRMRGLPDGQKPPTKSPSSTSTRNRDYVQGAVRLALQAAEALDHAHTRGILHRDIKPGNLLLDAGGRLWVTDFGLAQVRGDDRVTLTGDVLGTLRYMSPEQALGRRTVIDGRTDVYSLGVTLYELLTLRPAIDGRDRAEILRRIADAEPTPPRKLNPAVPADLETIVLKATAKEAAGRYATAQELTEDLRSFLEHRPIRARRPGLLDRAAKWSRRHRAVVMTAAALLVLGTVGTSIGMVRALRAEHRARTAEGLATDRLVAVTKEKERATAAEAKAKDEAAAAEAVITFLQNDLLGQASPDENARDKKVTVEEVLGRAAARIAGKFAQHPAVEAKIRRTIGNTYRALSLYTAARPHLERAWELYRTNLGEEDLDSLRALSDLANLYMDQGQAPDPEPLFTKVLKVRSRLLGEENAERLDSLILLAEVHRLRGRYSEARPLLDEAVTISRRALGEEHNTTLTAMNNLGVLYLGQRRYADAEPLLAKVLEVNRRNHGEEHPETLTSMNNLSEVYVGKGEYLRAAELLEKTLEISRRVRGVKHELTGQVRHNLARVYRIAKRLHRPIPLLEEEVREFLALSGSNHPGTIQAMANLGIEYRDAGRLPEAIATLAMAWELERKRKGPPPDPHSLIPMALADAYDRACQFTSSEPLYREALEAARKRYKEEPLRAADVLDYLGRNLLKQRRHAEADPLLRESLAIREQKQPNDDKMFNTKALLGDSLLSQKKYVEAESLLLAGYEEVRQREGTIPSPNGKFRLTEAIERLVLLYEARGKLERAAEWRARLPLAAAELPADVFARP
jgi:tetratricopeptide (TPR) repeat protein